MSLSEYKKKRVFQNTPEPEGGKSQGSALRFVIQKHQASHLHYDFRLEMEGVLKSWAVPKGPSLDPQTKRLAMMVEDHPYAYKDFEGVIPEGNYGAGTVIIWDEGTYEPIDPGKGKKEQEKQLLAQLQEGSLKFVLKGSKVKGEFALVKTTGMGENAWLLIKHKDEFANKKDILKQDKSVVSGKNLMEMKADADAVWESDRPKKNKGSAKTKETSDDSEKKKAVGRLPSEEQKEDGQRIEALLKKGKKQAFPKEIQPMLATLVDAPFDDGEWEFEVKWDGYRALAYLDGEKVQIMSRNQKSFNEKYYPITEALKEWNRKMVVDGEIVVVNEQGVSEFNALQNWRSEADGQLLYYVFDVLWMDGKNLMDLPLAERMEIIEQLLPEIGTIRRGFSVREIGKQFYQTADKMNLEGIIAKKLSSRYSPGARSKEWLKIKTIRSQEVVIGGYTKNEGSPKLFSALLVGAYEGGQLRYAGKVGTGFTDKQQKELIKAFEPYIQKTSPFEQEPDYNKPSRFRPEPPNARVTWMKPKLVAMVKFTEITPDGIFRHPSFLGLRTDKDPEEVAQEREHDVETTAEVDAKTVKKTKKVINEAEVVKAPGEAVRKTLLNPSEETQVKVVNRHSLKFTNLSKVYWPEEGYTKRDLINYYYQVAPFILPYLKNRPQSMNRFPNGIHGKSFYQKDITGKVPAWIKKMPYTSNEEKGINKHFLVGWDEASLLYMANLGAIEMNPWSSTVDRPDHPDWCILDLDPGSKSTFDDVIETARAIHRLLEQLKVPSYPKTSGSTGMHIYVPLGAQYTYEQSQLFGKWIATQIRDQLPETTSIERIVKERKGKLYIDYLQNRPQATLAAPYSVRPKPGATVSMPLHWDEVKKGLKITDFNLANSIGRVEKMGDLFLPVLGKGIKLEELLKG